MKSISLCSLLLITFCACCTETATESSTDSTLEIKQLRFIGEQIISEMTTVDGMQIGGLSGIDFKDGTYYMISDTSFAPFRFFKANIDFDQKGIRTVSVEEAVELTGLKKEASDYRTVDPEGMRFVPQTGTLFWISEGNAKKGFSPKLYESSLSGELLNTYSLPKEFDAKGKVGPRQNGALESICLSFDKKGLWLGMELPLKQDGEAPTVETGNSPVRIVYFDLASKSFGKQFVYELESISRSFPTESTFGVNGLVEILEYSPNQFLMLERSYVSDHEDGGNDVKLFSVDNQKNSDVSGRNLEGSKYVPSKKNLLFDFNSIREKLTKKNVDNLEGMTFGPILENGNRTLIFVSDNNFNSVGGQMNQLIVFEVKAK